MANYKEALIIPNEGMDDFIRIIKSLEISKVLINGVSETVKHKMNKLKGGSVGMLLGTLDAFMLRNFLTGKCVQRAGKCAEWAERGYNNMDKKFQFRSIF